MSDTVRSIVLTVAGIATLAGIGIAILMVARWALNRPDRRTSRTLHPRNDTPAADLPKRVRGAAPKPVTVLPFTAAPQQDDGDALFEPNGLSVGEYHRGSWDEETAP